MNKEYLTHYIKNYMGHLSNMVTSFYGWLVLVIAQLLVIDGVKSGIIVLSAVFIVDYITGVGASWKEWKLQKTTNPKELPPYFFQSHKIRKSLLKAITYFLFIGMAWVMWYLFFDGKINLPMSSKDANIISIAFGLCIAVECWSILENTKRMGFDLIGQISKTVKGFWSTYRDVKGDN